MRTSLLLASLLVTAPLPAQTPPLTFEVASIREAPAGAPGGVQGGCHGINTVYPPGQQIPIPPLGTCVISDARLSHMIGIAWGVAMASLKTGPDWIQRGELRFHVQAKAEDPSKATEQQLLTMLQNLLVERFRLKFHYETTETAGLALTVAKSGAKLTASQADQVAILFIGPNGETLPKPLPGIPLIMKARKFSMATLANLLSFMQPNRVVDHTGLTGQYDFTLSWDEDAGPALSTALREQLGLALESTKIATQTLVVDSAEKPTPN